MGQPYPGDDFEPDLNEHRFCVYRISDTQYLVMDSAVDFECVIEDEHLQNSTFLLNFWYARERQKIMNTDFLDGSMVDRYPAELGDALIIGARAKLEQAAWDGSRDDSEFSRFHVQDASDGMLTRMDLPQEVQFLLPRTRLLDQSFDLVAWYRSELEDCRRRDAEYDLVSVSESDAELLTYESSTDSEMPPLQAVSDSDEFTPEVRHDISTEKRKCFESKLRRVHQRSINVVERVTSSLTTTSNLCFRVCQNPYGRADQLSHWEILRFLIPGSPRVVGRFYACPLHWSTQCLSGGPVTAILLRSFATFDGSFPVHRRPHLRANHGEYRGPYVGGAVSDNFATLMVNSLRGAFGHQSRQKLRQLYINGNRVRNLNQDEDPENDDIARHSLHQSLSFERFWVEEEEPMKSGDSDPNVDGSNSRKDQFLVSVDCQEVIWDLRVSGTKGNHQAPGTETAGSVGEDIWGAHGAEARRRAGERTVETKAVTDAQASHQRWEGQAAVPKTLPGGTARSPGLRTTLEGGGKEGAVGRLRGLRGREPGSDGSSKVGTAGCTRARSGQEALKMAGQGTQDLHEVSELLAFRMRGILERGGMQEQAGSKAVPKGGLERYEGTRETEGGNQGKESSGGIKGHFGSLLWWDSLNEGAESKNGGGGYFSSGKLDPKNCAPWRNFHRGQSPEFVAVNLFGLSRKVPFQLRTEITFNVFSIVQGTVQTKFRGKITPTVVPNLITPDTLRLHKISLTENENFHLAPEPTNQGPVRHSRPGTPLANSATRKSEVCCTPWWIKRKSHLGQGGIALPRANRRQASDERLILEVSQPYPGDERAAQDERHQRPRFNVERVCDNCYVVVDDTSFGIFASAGLQPGLLVRKHPGH
ncbi:hypothetical protein C8F04DRAFT_1174729 [Mycena alexandri]|uniref:Uncharacterized protein n=1 Tax=Mycena alexandri TaxID=1745969 RepID=A0AAD6TFA6_9AGAR|nr:hypothetical protein C8F04DRAFT_1174729 [Mycena alexandri]